MADKIQPKGAIAAPASNAVQARRERSEKGARLLALASKWSLSTQAAVDGRAAGAELARILYLDGKRSVVIDGVTVRVAHIDAAVKGATTKRGTVVRANRAESYRLIPPGMSDDADEVDPFA